MNLIWIGGENTKCFLYFFTLCLELYISHIVEYKTTQVHCRLILKYNLDFNPESQPTQRNLFRNGTNCLMVTSLMGFFLHITHCVEHEKFCRQIIADNI